MNLQATLSFEGSVEARLSVAGQPDETKLICETEVVVVEFSAELLAELRRDPTELLRLTPEQFELFVCERLEAMGMEIRRVGATNRPDGGIDIFAWPREASFPFLIGVQAKHHRVPSEKVSAPSVREFDAVVCNRKVNAGLLVTNTSFTANAAWEVENHKHITRLRDFDDLRRWIADNFVDEAEWREIPDRIEYAPGKFVNLKQK